MKKLPIINNNGFIDANGNTYKSINELPNELKELAKLYSYFEYNLIFDKEHMLSELNQ